MYDCHLHATLPTLPCADTISAFCGYALFGSEEKTHTFIEKILKIQSKIMKTIFPQYPHILFIS